MTRAGNPVPLSLEEQHLGMTQAMGSSPLVFPSSEELTTPQETGCRLERPSSGTQLGSAGTGVTGT